VVGEHQAYGSAWLARRTTARAVVLALDAAVHRRWSLIDHWAWGASGAFGLVAESEVEVFLAQVPAGERERFALWPSEQGAGRSLKPGSTHGDTQVLERVCERALARRTAGPGRGALFVDRDGTLIAERHHLADPDGVALLPGVAGALRSARAAGLPVVVISNQAGVGRGLFDEARVHAVMARLRGLLRREGVELDAVRFCPHAPEAGCDCRKPGTRLLVEAAEDLRLDPYRSVMIGDKWVDVEAGLAFRSAGVLVRTGHGATEAEGARAVDAPVADRVFADLAEAVRWWLSQLD
jgi:histidinol-phosphate phosphatase family protein